MVLGGISYSPIEVIISPLQCCIYMLKLGLTYILFIAHYNTNTNCRQKVIITRKIFLKCSSIRYMFIYHLTDNEFALYLRITHNNASYYKLAIPYLPCFNYRDATKLLNLIRNSVLQNIPQWTYTNCKHETENIY